MSKNTEDNWQKLGDVTANIVERLRPVLFSVTLQATLAEALKKEAADVRCKPETLIAEAVRAYFGDAA